MFEIEAVGEEEDQEEKENMLQKFIEYIEIRKVVMIEDIAAEFNMSTPAVVDRIQALESSGRLLGISDDRGKYIHITENEFDKIGAYIKASGRVSKTDLLKEVNALVRMIPKAEDKKRIQEEQKAMLQRVEKEYEEDEEEANK